MSQKITEPTFNIYFAPRFKIPVPGLVPAGAPASQIKQALERWGGRALVKPDVLTGRRSKSGMISKVSSVQAAVKELTRAAGTEVNGILPRGAYLVQDIPARWEVYTSLTYSTSHLGPLLSVSLKGGVDIEEIDRDQICTVPVDIFEGLDAYQAGEALRSLGWPQTLVSSLSRALIAFWDMFISSGMEHAEINPWRITPEGRPYACDFKGTLDEANYKCRVPGITLPEYPTAVTDFEDEMQSWSSSSHQGQAHVSDLGGSGILPLLFGGGASTIITEVLHACGGDPMFLSDFGGNPPYERMYGTARRCFDYRLGSARLLLILGGKANNTFIDVTFQAIADALADYCRAEGPPDIPVVIGRGGPKLMKGFLIMQQTLEQLQLPYVIFGPESPVTMVAEYAARLAAALGKPASIAGKEEL
jgi:succinyl-CoA synthetase beta subunit